jgi:hypothetical protein
VTTQLQFLLIAVAGCISRHQQAVIEYLQEENRILLEQLGGKPKRFTDAQRIRLARKAKLVGRRRLGKLATRVTPDTLLIVHPKLFTGGEERISVGSVSWSPKSGPFPEPIPSVDHPSMRR